MSAQYPARFGSLRFFGALRVLALPDATAVFDQKLRLDI
jgi:hypothetical protein